MTSIYSNNRDININWIFNNQEEIRNWKVKCLLYYVPNILKSIDWDDYINFCSHSSTNIKFVFIECEFWYYLKYKYHINSSMTSVAEMSQKYVAMISFM